jgi:hypothetical protein
VELQINCANQRQVDNDEQQGARDVWGPMPRGFVQDLRYANTEEMPDYPCALALTDSVWYRLPPAGVEREIAVDTFGSGFDTMLAVFRSDGADLTSVACNANYRVRQSRIVWRTDATSEYLVAAGTQDDAVAGTLRLNFSEGHIPENDDLASPMPVEIDGGTIVQSANSATTAITDPAPSCRPVVGYTLWFSVVAPVAAELRADTVGSTYDTTITVFERGQGGLTEIACDDSGTADSTGWAATADKQYLVMVGSKLGLAAGTLHLSVTAP